jgi:hypothetical protein
LKYRILYSLRSFWPLKDERVSEDSPRIEEEAVFGSGFKQVSGSVSGFGIRIRIQEGKNDPQKKKKIKKFNISK